MPVFTLSVFYCFVDTIRGQAMPCRPMQSVFLKRGNVVFGGVVGWEFSLCSVVCIPRNYIDSCHAAWLLVEETGG